MSLTQAGLEWNDKWQRKQARRETANLFVRTSWYVSAVRIVFPIASLIKLVDRPGKETLQSAVQWNAESLQAEF